MSSINRLLIFIFSIIIALIFSCNPNEKRDYKPLIIISYYKGLIESPVAIKCGQVSKIPPIEFKVDTLISDTSLIHKISNCASNLRTEASSNCEGRLDCFIIQNSDTTKLCIGTFDCIKKNGIGMHRNDTLLYLIRKNSGYYNYFRKDELRYFDELKIFDPDLLK